jgi:hypothetical protein
LAIMDVAPFSDILNKSRCDDCRLAMCCDASPLDI